MPTTCAASFAAVVHSPYIGWGLALTLAGATQLVVESGGLALLLSLLVCAIRAAPTMARRAGRMARALASRFGALVFILGVFSVSFGLIISAGGAEGAVVPGPVGAQAASSVLWAGNAVGLPAHVQYAGHAILREQANFAVVRTSLAASDARDLADSLGLPRTSVPCALSAKDNTPSFQELRDICTCLNLGDSGSGVHAVNSTKYAVAGSICANTTSLATANGLCVPPTKCVARIPYRMPDGTKHHLVLRDCVILPDSEHNLISLGRLALDEGVATYIAPGSQHSRLIFGDGTHARMLNVGVLVLPDAAVPANVVLSDDLPVHGQSGRQNVGWDTLHRRFNHRPWAVLKHLSNATRDAPKVWQKALSKPPNEHCDACLRAHADKVPSHRHAPVATAPGSLVSFDIYTTGLGHIHGGQRNVMGFHDHYSGVDKVYLLHHKSDAFEAIKKYIAWCKSHNVSVRRMHTDNAPEFHIPQLKDWLDDRGIRLTSCAPNEPRGNGVMERRWRIMGDDARGAINHSNCTPAYWWYFLRGTVLVANHIPGSDGVAPWMKFTGIKPDARGHRVLGCLGYYKVIKPESKMHPKARRCINFGRCEDQPGYCCFDIELNKVIITPHPAFGLCLDPLRDWDMFYDAPHASFDESTPAGAAAPNSWLVSVGDVLGRNFTPQLYETGIDGQCFAAPRACGDPDNPTAREALTGPERSQWAKARQAEYENLLRHQAFEEVLEDTLSTWDAFKKRASEVVSIIEVFKKKYIDNVFDKFKARWVYDGRMQKVANQSSEHPLDTFAPTVRHSTHKCLVAEAVRRGAANTTLSSKAYVERIAAEVLPKPLSEYAPMDVPSGPSLFKDYLAAVEDRANVCPKLAKSYPVKVGKIVYAMPASRCEAAYTIGVLTRCLQFPTPAMDAHANACLVYLAQHSDLGPTFGANDTPGIGMGLVAFSDSDWQVDCSTSGWCIMYGGAVVSYGSKRQECIALSSTEAEIMAASQCSAEIMYIRGLLGEMGVDLAEPTTLYVDNSGAVELSKDMKSCRRSRHIERRYLKVRELAAQEHLRVQYVPTELNVADMLTKSLGKEAHGRHMRAALNTPAAAPHTAVKAPAGVSRKPQPAASASPARQLPMALVAPNGTFPPGVTDASGAAPTWRQRTFDVEAAYLKGKFNETEVHYARPPPGYRTFLRGVPIVWKLRVPLYGEADAGRIWNRTLIKQLVGKQKFQQSQYDPCYFWKFLSDGTRMDMVIYVDDGYVIDAFSAAADAELAELDDAFTITIKPAHFFLGNNVIVHDGSEVGAP